MVIRALKTTTTNLAPSTPPDDLGVQQRTAYLSSSPHRHSQATSRESVVQPADDADGIFTHAPVSLCEEDFGGEETVCPARRSSVEELRKHFKKHPEEAARSHLHIGCFIRALFFVLVAFSPNVVHAQVQRMEIHTFQSVTLSDKQFLMGEKNGKPVTIAGELRLPPGKDRLPAIILVHSSGGIGGYVTDWEQYLNEMGVATFIIDGLTPRGIVNTSYDHSQLGLLAMVFDVYHALELLAKHPRIDPARIAVMGFSIGGHVALYASKKRFQRMYGPANLEFAAYIAFYPLCDITYRDEDNVSDKPIRLFQGTADTMVPIAACRAYVERLKTKGKDVQLTEYAGATHIFDWKAYMKPTKFEKMQTPRQCQLAEAQDGVIINVKTKEPFTWADPCVRYGVTFAYDERATAEARKAIKDFVTATLKP